MPVSGAPADSASGTGAPVRVVHVLEATAGGTRRWLENAVFGLDPTRIQNIVVCAVRRDPSFVASIERFRSLGVAVSVVDMQRSINPIRDAIAVYRLRKVLRSCSCDVVHAHSAKAGILTRAAAALSGIRPVVYSPHAFPFLAKGLARPLYYWIEKLARLATDYLLAVSESESRFARLLGYRQNQVFTVVNGTIVPPARPTEQADVIAEPRIGAVMELRAQKDSSTFIRACGLLQRNCRNVTFVLCGSGPLLTQAKTLAKAEGIESAMTFTGQVDDVPTRLASWDVFVMATQYEGMSYALLEAMAAGKPIVASRVPGVEEVLSDGENGILVPSGDPVSMANAIQLLLTDRSLAQRLGAAARQSVIERYTLQRQLDELTLFYEAVARKKRAL